VSCCPDTSIRRNSWLSRGLLVVSPWFEQRREAYQDVLFGLSCDGDLNAWTSFFSQGVAASAAESQRKVERLVELQKELRTRVQGARKRGAAERPAGDLVGSPFVTRNSVANQYELTGQGARNAIATLESPGILKPIELRAAHGAQLFVCNVVVRVISS